MQTAAVTADRDSILSSLDTLLNTMSIEANELREKERLESGYAEQIAALERQRSVVHGLMDNQQNTDEKVSKYVTETFWQVLLDSTDRWQARNDRMLGLYRSAGAMIMSRNWTADSPSTTDWVESFHRSIDRRRKEVLAESTMNDRLIKLSYLKELEIPKEIYTDPEYRGAPKEYWRQYAAFKLVGSALTSRKESVELATEMAPAFDLLRLAVG